MVQKLEDLKDVMGNNLVKLVRDKAKEWMSETTQGLDVFLGVETKKAKPLPKKKEEVGQNG